MPGPFFFAWVNSDETTFNPAVHNREDENIYAFSADHAEGEFASLTIEIRNPRIGLLAPSRKQWAWLSWDNGSAIEPLFFGRLVGIPTSINQEIVTLVFSARPADYATRKATVADSMRVLPFYDPVWIAPDKLSDPDVVLEAYSALWHIDRVTHEVTASEILVGDNPVVAFSEADVFYDSVSIEIGTPPLRSATVEGKVGWTQRAGGFLDMGKHNIRTYTGGSLMSNWPKPGANIGGGWEVAGASCRDAWGVENTVTASFSASYTNNSKKHANGDAMSASWSSSLPQFTGPYLQCVLSSKSQTGLVDPGDPLSEIWGAGDPISIPSSFEVNYFYVPLWLINTTLSLSYKAARKREETVSFVLTTNVQPLITLPGEEESMEIKLSSVDVSMDIPGYGRPLADGSQSNFLPSPRGQQSLQYLIALARSTLLLRSRAVSVSFACRFERAIALSCRKHAQIEDHRLPGGSASGKVVAYSFSVKGDSGELIGNVTIGCAIGYGGAVTEVAGTPDYVEEGYVERGYQTYSNTINVLPTGDVGFSPPVYGPGNDDGVIFPLTRRQAVMHEVIHGTEKAQKDLIEAAFASNILIAEIGDNPAKTVEAMQQAALAAKSTVEEVMKTNAIWYDLQLRPLTGAFAVAYQIAPTQLEVPRMIDLEAGSSP